MADRIAVMHRGRIEQMASATEIYDRPATLFVNQFVGTTNVLSGRIVATDGAGTEVALVAGVLRTPPSQLMQGADVIVSVRPEHFRVQDEGESGQLSGIVKVVMPLGPQVIYDVEIPGGTGVKISQPRDAVLRKSCRSYGILEAHLAEYEKFDFKEVDRCAKDRKR